MVQWLRLHVSAAGSTDLIPDEETKIAQHEIIYLVSSRVRIQTDVSLIPKAVQHHSAMLLSLQDSHSIRMSCL